MSLLSRDEIRIFIGPQQVHLVRLGGRIRQHVADVRAVCVTAPAPEHSPWQSALAALETLLEEFRTCKANVVVVLSNHFVRYALVRHSAETNGADEQQALIHHYFTTIYGSAADHWEYRLSETGNDEYQVAVAISPALPQSLDALFTQTNLVLHSIQPHLMAAFNLLRNEVGDNAWFALIEPGLLCLARLDHSQWRFLRTVNHHDNWIDELAANLLRAKIMTAAAASDLAGEVPVYVFAPGHCEAEWTRLENRAEDLFGASPLRLLRPPQLFDDDLPVFATALSG